MSHKFYAPARSRLQRSELAVPGSSPKMFEKALMPVSKVLGWKPYFPFSEFDSYAKLDVREISKVNLFNYWNIIHATNNK